MRVSHSGRRQGPNARADKMRRRDRRKGRRRGGIQRKREMSCANGDAARAASVLPPAIGAPLPGEQQERHDVEQSPTSGGETRPRPRRTRLKGGVRVWGGRGTRGGRGPRGGAGGGGRRNVDERPPTSSIHAQGRLRGGRGRGPLWGTPSGATHGLPERRAGAREKPVAPHATLVIGWGACRELATARRAATWGG